MGMLILIVLIVLLLGGGGFGYSRGGYAGDYRGYYHGGFGIGGILLVVLVLHLLLGHGRL